VRIEGSTRRRSSSSSCRRQARLVALCIRCVVGHVYNFNLRDVGHKLRPVNDRTALQNFDPQPSEFCLTASYSDGVLNPSFRQPCPHHCLPHSSLQIIVSAHLHPHHFHHPSHPLASPAMGHWGTCPPRLPTRPIQFFWSLLFRVAQTLTFGSMWLPIEKNIIHAYSFVTVYYMNFVIFFVCHP